MSSFSFQLVNHQLKHLFGGIGLQVERNASIQVLENQQKKIIKAMEKAVNVYRKVNQGANSIKQSIFQLNENWEEIEGLPRKQTSLLSSLNGILIQLLTQISQEALSLSRQMQEKVQLHQPMLKRIKQKYEQSAEKLQHYRQKVGLLEKGIQKQTAALVGQEQFQRFQRNKEKCKQAQKEYDDMLIKITKKFVEFNRQSLLGMRYDVLSFISTLTSSTISTQDSLLSQLSHPIISNHSWTHRYIIHQQKIIDEDQQIFTEKKAVEWISAVVRDKQGFKLIRQMLQEETDKLMGANVNKIQERFGKQNIKSKSDNFTNFKNVYNGDSKLMAKAAKKQVIEPNLVKKKSVDHHNLLELIEIPPINPSIIAEPHKPHHHDEEKMKQNLDKFNQLFSKPSQNNHPTYQNVPQQIAAHKIPIQQLKSPIYQSHQGKSKKHIQSPRRKEQKSIKLHEFQNIDYFNQESKEHPKKQELQIKNSNTKSQQFLNFDFFGVVPHPPEKPKQNQQLITLNHPPTANNSTKTPPSTPTFPDFANLINL